MAEESVGTVTRADLAAALKTVKPAVASQFGGRAGAAPVHFEWTPSGLSVGGHNSAYYVDYLVPYEGEHSRGTDDRAVALYVRREDIERSLSILRGELTVTFCRANGAPQVVIADDTTKVTCGEVVIHEPRLDPLPVPADAVEHSGDEGLVRLVRQVSRCASNDEMRPILTLVHFEPRRIAATDSYRLAIGETEGHVLPPADIPRESTRWLPKTGDWTFYSEGQRLWWTDDRVTVYCPGLQRTTLQKRKGKRPIKVPVTVGSPGYLPLYEPSADYKRVHFNRAELHAAVKRIADAANTCKVDNAALSLAVGPTYANLSVCIKVSNPPIEMSINVAREGTGAMKPLVAFNPFFLAEALESFDTETVFIAHLDGLKPARIGSVEDDALGLLLMPIRTS